MVLPSALLRPLDDPPRDCPECFDPSTWFPMGASAILGLILMMALVAMAFAVASHLGSPHRR